MERTRDTWESIRRVKYLMYENKNALINIPVGTTSRLLPLDVVINKPFKNYFRELEEKSLALRKKCSFSLRISSVNVTKFAGNRGFGHIY